MDFGPVGPYAFPWSPWLPREGCACRLKHARLGWVPTRRGPGGGPVRRAPAAFARTTTPPVRRTINSIRYVITSAYRVEVSCPHNSAFLPTPRLTPTPAPQTHHLRIKPLIHNKYHLEALRCPSRLQRLWHDPSSRPGRISPRPILGQSDTDCGKWAQTTLEHPESLKMVEYASGIAPFRTSLPPGNPEMTVLHGSMKASR